MAIFSLSFPSQILSTSRNTEHRCETLRGTHEDECQQLELGQEQELGDDRLEESRNRKMLSFLISYDIFSSLAIQNGVETTQ
ncbi:hypothetical protein CEXT_354801 [Caerostris extrusa]|uniref:Uncharacterized protein n=1 Tax=Caerostris extrusa TaxID=172846 RepID=A0AAV4S867_CAEEX|nr:hypothetical protein CEXT_354801 [Caerostris extrusa]